MISKLYAIKIKVNDNSYYELPIPASEGAVEIIKKVVQHNITKIDGEISWPTGSYLTPENDPKVLYGGLSDTEYEVISGFIKNYIPYDIYKITGIQIVTTATESLL